MTPERLAQLRDLLAMERDQRIGEVKAFADGMLLRLSPRAAVMAELSALQAELHAARQR